MKNQDVRCNKQNCRFNYAHVFTQHGGEAIDHISMAWRIDEVYMSSTFQGMQTSPAVPSALHPPSESLAASPVFDSRNFDQTYFLNYACNIIYIHLYIVYSIISILYPHTISIHLYIVYTIISIYHLYNNLYPFIHRTWMTSEVSVHFPKKPAPLPQVELPPVGAPAGPGKKWTQYGYFWCLLGPQNLMISIWL